MARSFPVWLVRFNLAMQDPDMESPRFHTILFVETDNVSGGGFTHHVTGDITSRDGMRYEARKDDRPEDREDFNSKDLLGYADESSYTDDWNALLAELPTPPRQKAYNISTNRTEPVKTWEPLTFYEPGEARKPLMKCTEWVLQSAIPTVRSRGLLRPVG